jgi:putative glutathione S-transferase
VAFRERRGADPVNGFTLLAEAYEATEPGYRGNVSVPAL